jgi:hypothetical protein
MQQPSLTLRSRLHASVSKYPSTDTGIVLSRSENPQVFSYHHDFTRQQANPETAATFQWAGARPGPPTNWSNSVSCGWLRSPLHLAGGPLWPLRPSAGSHQPITNALFPNSELKLPSACGSGTGVADLPGLHTSYFGPTERERKYLSRCEPAEAPLHGPQPSSQAPDKIARHPRSLRLPSLLPHRPPS